MRADTKLLLIVLACVITPILAVAVFACIFPSFFFYHLDSGKNFTQIERVVSPNHLHSAVLAVKPPGDSLTGNHWFLLVGNETCCTQDELNRAYHYWTYSFMDTHESVGNLHISWADNTNLTVTCSPCEAEAIGIERKRSIAGPVRISYVGIPESPFPDSQK
jgi:hypothetical protein